MHVMIITFCTFAMHQHAGLLMNLSLICVLTQSTSCADPEGGGGGGDRGSGPPPEKSQKHRVS